MTAEFIITNGEKRKVFSSTEDAGMYNFLLSANPGEYEFLVSRGMVTRRGTLNIPTPKPKLNDNQQSLLNYIQKRYGGDPLRDAELTIPGKTLAQELVSLGYVTLNSDK